MFHSSFFFSNHPIAATEKTITTTNNNNKNTNIYGLVGFGALGIRFAKRANDPASQKPMQHPKHQRLAQNINDFFSPEVVIELFKVMAKLRIVAANRILVDTYFDARC